MALHGYPLDACVELPDDTLQPFLLGAAAQARQRIWAAVFLVDPRTGTDRDLRVRTLLRALGDAAWRGVDVRLLMPQSNTVEIATANRVAQAAAQHYGIAARRSAERGGSHSKMVVVDADLAVVGSHNWTHRAFTLDSEDSVAVRSAPLAADLADRFAEAWAAAGSDAWDAPIVRPDAPGRVRVTVVGA